MKQLLQILILLLLPLGLLFFGIQHLMRDVNSYSFPSTFGKIIDAASDASTQKHLRMMQGTYYSVYVTYQYRVGNSTYQNRLQVCNDVALESSKRVFSQYPKGASVRVYYNPEHPDRSSFTVGRDLTADIVFLLLCLILPSSW